MGTFFTTLHRVGVALWSGPSFNNFPHQRFTHSGVRLIDFSPCERYLVTWSSEPIVPAPILDESAPRDPRKFGPEDEGNQLAVWEIKTGHLLRTLPGEAPAPPQAPDAPPARRMAWPLLRWSPDDAYVARCNMGTSISVYELPSMGLLDRKSIKIEGVLDFEWCPDAELSKQEGKENMLAFWTPEEGNQPARVSIMGLPSRSILRSKNLFNVSDVSGFVNEYTFVTEICYLRNCFTEPHLSITDNSTVQNPMARSRVLPLCQGRSIHQDQEEHLFEFRIVPCQGEELPCRDYRVER